MTATGASTGFLLFLLVGLLAQPVSAAILNYQDTTQDFWEPLPFSGGLPSILSTKAVFWQDSSIQGKILTVGGSVDPTGVTFNVTDAVYELDVATDRWTQRYPGGDNFTARANHLAVVLENAGVQYVAVYGGLKSVPGVTLLLPIQDFALLNLDTFTWENRGLDVSEYNYFYDYLDRTCCSSCAITDCPSARQDPAGLVFDYDLGTMYVYGGVSDGDFLSDLWKYHLSTDTWSLMTISNSITPARGGSAVQALSRSSVQRIVVVGGYYLTGPLGTTPVLLNDLWVLDETSPDTWKWTQVMADGNTGPQARTNPLNVLVNSLLFMWGGGTAVSTTILAGPMWVLDTSPRNLSHWAWQSLSLAPPGFEPIPLTGPGLVYINSTRTLTSVGGTTSGGVSVRDLYRFHPLGLLPPLTLVLPDVPNGYDLNLDNRTTTEFNNSSPSFHVKNRNSGVSFLTTTFGSLIEVDPFGQQVTEFDLTPDNGFLLLYNKYDPKLGYKVTVFTRHAVPGSGSGTSTDAVSVRFEFYQYANDSDVNSLPPGSSLAPQQFFVNGGHLKFNVRVSNWPFASTQNNLVLTMGFAFPSLTTLTSQFTSFGSSYTFDCAEGSTTLRVLSSSVQDYNSLRPVVTDIALASATTANLKFTFRYFSNNVFFDPSLGTLVTPSSNDDNSGSDNTGIYVGVFVSVGVVALVVLVVLAVSVAVILWLRHTHQTSIKVMQAQISGSVESDYSSD